VKMSSFSGDQIAQVNNPDPFAVPVWRSPVFHTPGWIIALVQLLRLLRALVVFLARHPLLDLTAASLAVSYADLGWPAVIGLVLTAAAGLAAWRWQWPGSFSRFVARPVLGKWRRWHYRRHWAAVMTIGRLAPMYQGRLLLPVLGNVTSTAYTDRVAVRLVSGQPQVSPAGDAVPA
jgi:hypothetical protein